ncbi:ATP-binding protein [Duganella sp. HH101]|uniref:ATP-binding protein n=1 Tax=Duganella sp. HH101 TaxID=1781066 RepID=UPI0008937C41|nr:ATP-binding protein [Duganella sp. HH101]OFA05653.1 hypothetical protein DUGA2_12320 [Duganella sp. HH101]
MRIRTLTAAGPEQGTGLKIQFGKRDPTGGNFFSILVGENGTRKSQSLRAILDLSYSSVARVRQLGRIFEGKQGEIVYWSSRNSERSVLPTKIIAVSGVATDRFPSRLTSRVRKPGRTDIYRYIGPRSENNLVSRAQSLLEIVRILIAHLDRVPDRLSELKSAFELLPFSKGCLFEFKRTDGETKGIWSAASLLKHLRSTEPAKAGRFEEGDAALREQCLDLLNSKQTIRLTLDLDDIGSAGFSRKVSAAALGFALECGAISLDKSYLLTQSGGQLSLSEFSSGQWHILSSLLFVSLAVEDDTLILIDEPENSLHPQWQREYLNLFVKAISSCDGVHVIVATHSPLVASSLPPDQAEVIRLGRTRFGNVVAKELAAGPFGWTTDDILEKVFGLRSTRSQLFVTEMDRALKLFAKGDRRNPTLVKLVRELAEFAKFLPEEDVARSVIATLRSVVLSDDPDTKTAE